MHAIGVELSSLMAKFGKLMLMPDAYAFRVEGAKPWAKKCKHCCSRDEVLSCPTGAEEWDKGKNEPPEPAA